MTVELNPEVVEAALRELQTSRDAVYALPSAGRWALASVEVDAEFDGLFAMIVSASEKLESGRKQLQQALSDVLLADANLDMSAVTEILGVSVGDVPIDKLLEAFRRADALDDTRQDINRGDDLAMSEGELDSVADRMATLSNSDRAYVINHLTDEENKRLFHNVHDQGISSNDWNDNERTRFYELYECLTTSDKARIGRFSAYLETLARAEVATAGNESTAPALEELRSNGGFKEASFNQRIALLAQVANYPSTASIGNLTLLAEKEWFRDFNIGDSQRSAKMIAFLSQYSPPEGDSTDAARSRIIIDNTLDSFLAPDAPYRFDWKADGERYGSASDKVFSFNRMFLEPGNMNVTSSVPYGIRWSDTKHMVTHTVAHEVNHLRNGGGVAASFDYFMNEYRAYTVGFEAEHGHPPSRDDVHARVNLFLHSDEGAYADIAQAVAEGGPEGAKIAEFLSEMIGSDVSASELAETWANLEEDPDVASTTPVAGDNGLNNLDNHD